MFKVKNGDLDHLGLLFERYHRNLFRFFYNRNGNIELSEGQVQNVFVRILRYRNKFQGTGAFRSWLFHIARNVHYDHYRKERIRYTEEVEAWEEHLIDPSVSPAQQLIQEEEMEKLKTALRQLAPEKREVLLLAKLNGMKYQEFGKDQ